MAVVGRGGVTIIDDLCELDEFAGEPWSIDQVSGMVVFDALQQTAGRRAILRDREAFPVFVDAVRSVEPAVRRTVERIAREVDETTQERLAETVRRIFGKVLRELSDVDNPMRTLISEGPGSKALFDEPLEPPEPSRSGEQERAGAASRLPSVPDPLAGTAPEEVAGEPPRRAGSGERARKLPTVVPDPSPDSVRSRYDHDARVVYYNDRHADYLLVKEDELALVEYLSTLVAKELVVYNNPRAKPDELAEEMVRMLVRVRRHVSPRG